MAKKYKIKKINKAQRGSNPNLPSNSNYDPDNPRNTGYGARTGWATTSSVNGFAPTGDAFDYSSFDFLSGLSGSGGIGQLQDMSPLFDLFQQGFGATQDSQLSADRASNDLIDKALNNREQSTYANLFDTNLGFKKGGKIPKYKKGKSIPTNPNGLYEESGPVVIPSRQLTFDGIDGPVMVVPIPGQDKVLEIPMNMFMKQDGGFIGNFANSGVPVQTETVKNGVAEQIIFSDASIATVNARRSHEKMKKDGDEDQVTDILPEGTFIASSYGGIKISRKQAEEFEIGIRSTGYSEHAQGMEPEVLSLLDLFKDNEKSLTPAELTLRVKKEYAVVDNDKDAFAEFTNAANKENRKAYLEGIIMYSQQEADKMKAKKAQAQEQKNLKKLVNEIAGVKIYKNGGKVMVTDVPKHQGFDPITATINAGSKLIGGIFNWNENRKRNNKINNVGNSIIDRGSDLTDLLLSNNSATNQSILDLINSGRADNQAGIQGSAIAQLAGLFSQDTNVDFTDRTVQGLDEALGNVRQARSSIPGQIFDQSTRQINTAALLEAGVDPSQIQQFQNQAISQGSDAALQANFSTLAQENQLLGQRDNVFNTNIAGRDQESNLERSLRNQILGQAGNVGAEFASASGQNSLSQSQELANQNNRYFTYTSNILNNDFQNYITGESVKLGTTNPLAGVDIAGIGQGVADLFNTGGNDDTNSPDLSYNPDSFGSGFPCDCGNGTWSSDCC